MNEQHTRTIWAEVTPVKGLPRDDDRRAIGCTMKKAVERCFYLHFTDEKNAMLHFKNMKRKTSKTYRVVLFTDKQFSQITLNDCYRVKLNKSQIDKKFYI